MHFCDTYHSYLIIRGVKLEARGPVASHSTKGEDIVIRHKKAMWHCVFHSCALYHSFLKKKTLIGCPDRNVGWVLKEKQLSHSPSIYLRPETYGRKQTLIKYDWNDSLERVGPTKLLSSVKDITMHRLVTTPINWCWFLAATKIEFLQANLFSTLSFRSSNGEYIPLKFGL